MKNIWPIIAIVLLTSCSASHKLRKAEKLIKKAEELGATWRVDTVIQKIAVPVPQIEVRAVHHAIPGDTVVVEKERLRVKVVRLPGDSIFVQGECLNDTILIEVPAQINKELIAKDGLAWWWLIVAAAAGLVIGAIIRLIK